MEIKNIIVKFSDIKWELLRLERKLDFLSQDIGKYFPKNIHFSRDNVAYLLDLLNKDVQSIMDTTKDYITELVDELETERKNPKGGE